MENTIDEFVYIRTYIYLGKHDKVIYTSNRRYVCVSVWEREKRGERFTQSDDYDVTDIIHFEL